MKRIQYIDNIINLKHTHLQTHSTEDRDGELIKIACECVVQCSARMEQTKSNIRVLFELQRPATYVINHE